MNGSFRVFGGVAEKSAEDFQRTVDLLYKNCDGLHVDVADGVFVANKLVDLAEIRLPEEVFCEAHLMVINPAEMFAICKQKGFRKVIMHPSVLRDESVVSLEDIYRRVRDLGMVLFWGYEIGSWPKAEHLKCTDGVMFMTVPLGFAGGRFEEGQIEKIARFKKGNPGCIVEVDGGVSDKTIAKIKRAGVDWVTSTSWLQSGGSVRQNYMSLKSIG